MTNPHKYCIATVTSENYFQWTMTMLYSFVTTNPWFKGDIVIICKDLPPAMAHDLMLFDRVKLVEPSTEILDKLIELGRELPKFNDLKARFYSLEIFLLAGYKKLVFLDSDMVVVKSIEELFALPDRFYACAQLCYYKGKGRNISTFESEALTDNIGEQARFFEKPVNTGFMLIDGTLLNKTHYSCLIDIIEPLLWKSCNYTYTDELVINHYFQNQISLLDTRYNYRARAGRMMREKEKIYFEDAKIIHFYSTFKPWNFGEVFTSSANNMNWIKAYETWYMWYVAFLKFYHLQKKLTNLQLNKKAE